MEQPGLSQGANEFRIPRVHVLLSSNDGEKSLCGALWVKTKICSWVLVGILALKRPEIDSTGSAGICPEPADTQTHIMPPYSLGVPRAGLGGSWCLSIWSWDPADRGVPSAATTALYPREARSARGYRAGRTSAPQQPSPVRHGHLWECLRT